MDAQAKKKALFRAKLNAQKKEKRIESPLVRLVLGAHYVLFSIPKHQFILPFTNLHMDFSICYTLYVVRHQLFSL